MRYIAPVQSGPTQPRTMHPLVKRFALACGAGLVVNVLLAWVIAIWGVQPDAQWLPGDTRTTHGTPRVIAGDREWMRHIPGAWTEPRWIVRRFGYGTTWITQYENVETFRPRLDVHQFGIPLRCLEYREFHTVDAVGSSTSGSLLATSYYLVPRTSDRQIPYSPLWLGLIVNTLLFGVVIGLLFMAARGVNRVNRRWRGLCPMCCYDVRGNASDVCPECGFREPPGGVGWPV